MEAGLTARYCSCMQDAVESRWNLFDYWNRHRTYVRELEADGTVARCAERGPSAVTTTGPGVGRLGWASSDAALLADCAAAGRIYEWSEGRTKAYCACMAQELESRWSADEYRARYAEIARELSASGGAVERCSLVSEGMPAH